MTVRETSTSPGPRERRDARGDMDGDALHFVRGNFDLAGMQAAADLQAERLNRLGDGLRATHGARRAIEGGEKPVSQRFHLIAAGAREFPPHDPMMRVQKIAPAVPPPWRGPRTNVSCRPRATRGLSRAAFRQARD